MAAALAFLEGGIRARPAAIVRGALLLPDLWGGTSAVPHAASSKRELKSLGERRPITRLLRPAALDEDCEERVALILIHRLIPLLPVGPLLLHYH